MNSEEIWKPVVGYEGLYEVSSLGRVRSLDRYDSNNHFLKGRILRLCVDTKGYLKVGLSSNGKVKTYMVHRMVVEAFIPNPDNLPEVNHIDEDKKNNRVDNLEMCDRKYNMNYGSRMDKVRDKRLKNGTYTGLSKEEYRKKRYQEKKDKINERSREYYQKNKEERREYNKKYYYKNREKICEYQKEYYRKKKEENIQNNVKSLNDKV